MTLPRLTTYHFLRRSGRAMLCTIGVLLGRRPNGPCACGYSVLACDATGGHDLRVHHNLEDLRVFCRPLFRDDLWTEAVLLLPTNQEVIVSE